RNDNFCGGPGPTIEIWYPGNPFFNLPHQGRTFAELNAFEYSTLYQTVCLMEGDEITWKFAHRGRGGDDEMVFQLATHDSDRTSWGGTTDIVQSRSPAGTGTPSQICGPLGTCLAPTQEN